ncbi:hypothetical protein HanHA300_Chr17g0671881 [Helianthus annuus]|nr:hypothetical protein HanHA300_Chr17g0671881 [Helianthus annuus]
MAWLKERGIACIAKSVLNSEELDKTVAYLVIAARNDRYAQVYAECSQYVNNALKVEWDTSKSVLMVPIVVLPLQLQRKNLITCSFLLWTL